MQNIHKTILKALKIRTLVRNWNSIFQLPLYFQLLYLYIPTIQKRLTTAIGFMVFKVQPQHTALYCQILLKKLHCTVHSVQMPLKSLKRKLFNYSRLLSHNFINLFLQNGPISFLQNLHILHTQSIKLY